MALAAPRDHTGSSSDVVPELVEDDEDVDVEGDVGDANPELRAGGDSSSVEQGWYFFIGLAVFIGVLICVTLGVDAAACNSATSNDCERLGRMRTDPQGCNVVGNDREGSVSVECCPSAL